MQRCIKVINLFGEKIKSVVSTFEDGIPNTTAKLKFEKMEADVQLRDGMPQGIYKVKREGIVAMGRFSEAKVAGPCWIAFPTHVSIPFFLIWSQYHKELSE